MAEHVPFLPGLSPVSGKPLLVAFDGGRLTSDAGVLVLAEIERKLGVADRLARCMEDPRAPERVRHGLAEMIRFRALMIAAGYADANDCDVLRADPAFKLAVGRLPESREELCSQPTMSRLENLPGATALKRMMAAMLDIDDTEDRVHGGQQLARERAGKDASPTVAIVDSQSVKSAEKGARASIRRGTMRASRSKARSGTSWSTRSASC